MTSRKAYQTGTSRHQGDAKTQHIFRCGLRAAGTLLPATALALMVLGDVTKLSAQAAGVPSILFQQARERDCQPYVGCNFEIYAMTGDGSGVTRLTNHPSWDASPASSPDGQKIAFQSNRDGNWEIYVMNADGSAPRRVGPGAGPKWSADWRFVLFIGPQDGEIYVMNANGSGARRLTSDPAVYDQGASWAPW